MGVSRSRKSRIGLTKGQLNALKRANLERQLAVRRDKAAKAAELRAEERRAQEAVRQQQRDANNGLAKKVGLTKAKKVGAAKAPSSEARVPPVEITYATPKKKRK